MKRKEKIAMRLLVYASVLLALIASARVSDQTPQKFGPPSGGYQLGIFSTTEPSPGALPHVVIHFVLKNINHSAVALIDPYNTASLRVADEAGRVYPRKCTDPVDQNRILNSTPLPNLAPGSQRTEPASIDLHCYVEMGGRYAVTASVELFIVGSLGTPGNEAAKPIATIVSNTLIVNVP